MKLFEHLFEREDLMSDLALSDDNRDWFDCDFVEDISNIMRSEKKINEEAL